MLKRENAIAAIMNLAFLPCIEHLIRLERLGLSSSKKLAHSCIIFAGNPNVLAAFSSAIFFLVLTISSKESIAVAILIGIFFCFINVFFSSK